MGPAGAHGGAQPQEGWKEDPGVGFKSYGSRWSMYYRELG